jgi:hypothetical protein
VPNRSVTIRNFCFAVSHLEHVYAHVLVEEVGSVAQPFNSGAELAVIAQHGQRGEAVDELSWRGTVPLSCTPQPATYDAISPRVAYRQRHTVVRLG